MPLEVLDLRSIRGVVRRPSPSEGLRIDKCFKQILLFLKWYEP